jgi:hypothetical protein
MATFTSSLPDPLLKMLEKKAQELSVPKNRLIERALSLYLDQLNKAAYVRSYKQMSKDSDLMDIVEEGLSDYYRQLSEEEK